MHMRVLCAFLLAFSFLVTHATGFERAGEYAPEGVHVASIATSTASATAPFSVTNKTMIVSSEILVTADIATCQQQYDCLFLVPAAAVPATELVPAIGIDRAAEPQPVELRHVDRPPIA